MKNMKKLTSLVLALAMCLTLCVPALAAEQERPVADLAIASQPIAQASSNDGAMARDYVIERFRVEKVEVYPSYYNSDTGSYYHYKSIGRYQLSISQWNVLTVSPTTTQALLDQLSAKGHTPARWYVVVTCYNENISNPMRYEYQYDHIFPGQKFTRSASSGYETFYFDFPVQNITESYMDGIYGGFYYSTPQAGVLDWGFNAAVHLNSANPTAL